MKVHEQFKNYSLARLVGILVSHETELMEDANSIPNACPLAFSAKEERGKGKKSLR